MILAIASGGGHFVQLKRVLSSFDDLSDVSFVSTLDRPIIKSECKYFKVIDCNISSVLKLIICFFQLLVIFFKVRPKIVITTGAAPGFIALVVARIFRCKTIWIDSIANADNLSLAGEKARYFADVWLTQWPELSSNNGPDYKGSVL